MSLMTGASEPAASARTSWSHFQRRVASVIKAIPRGQVLSYAQVATRAGRPGAARAVVRALRRISEAPWWRVIRSDGTVARQMAPKQLRRLAREGVRARGLRVLTS